MEIDITDITGREGSITKELQGLKNDIAMTERAVASQQSRWASNLTGNMGEDINAVLSGKKKVKVPLKLKIKYTFNNIIDILSRIV
jgi:hypothetical protein